MGSRPCLERIHQDLAKVHGVGRIVRDRELGHQLRKHARGVSTAKRSYLCRSGCDTCRKGKGGSSGRFQDVRKFVGRGRWPREPLLSALASPSLENCARRRNVSFSNVILLK